MEPVEQNVSEERADRLQREPLLRELALKMQREQEQQLKFESSLSELSVKFINLSAREVDGAIEDAQRLFCEALGLERSALFQYFETSPGVLLLTHLYECGEASIVSGIVQKRADPKLLSSVYWVRTDTTEPATYRQVDVESLWPWVFRQLQSGEPFILSSLDELPEEAAKDREAFRSYGTKSTVIMPMSSGGTRLGCITFASLRTAREWSEVELKRFRFIADVFTNALVRKRVEAALRESEQNLAMASQAGGVGLWDMRLDTRQVWATPKMRELLQFGPDEQLTFERFIQAVHPLDRDLIIHSSSKTLETGAEMRVEHRVVLPDGSIRWISVQGHRQCDPGGKSNRLTGASVDITERKRAEEGLQNSEERFRTLIENAGDGVEVLDPAGVHLLVNPARLRQLGYTQEEMLGMSIFDINPSLDPEQLKRHRQSVAAGALLRLEAVNRRKDGSTFPVEVTVSQIQLGGRTCDLAVVRDITERKVAEQALRDSYTEIKQLKDRLQAESDYLRAEIKTGQAHSEIIGRSRAIRQVLRQVEQVAPAECPVLVSGETGTGKELIAQEIHRLSARKGRVMVLVNCAALPSALVESELFGRERGAYTGALTSQVGRFEIADGSTIFLDEVGELSSEVQAKLLRVLQEGEFQRLGSPKTHKVNVRVIAATNRDLAEDVRKGRFREDLYYRLKVFPIEIPPLRERTEDIPLLVFAFMEEFARRMGKKITKINRRGMEALQNHPWPGNIRELRNVIEHSVILTAGDTLKLTAFGDSPSHKAAPVTLADAEREHISKTLEATGWRIKGPHGAAARLGLQPSTLYSRMQKLGIPHRRQKDAMGT